MLLSLSVTKSSVVIEGSIDLADEKVVRINVCGCGVEEKEFLAVD